MKKNYKIIIGIVIIILILFVIYKAFNIKNKVLQILYPKKYMEFVEEYSNIYNVDPLFILSIIKAESNFNKDAKSSSGAKGLMQLMDATAEEIAEKINEPLIEKENLFEPQKNIMIGTKYYSDLLKMYNGNILLALTAYNAGIGNVNNWIEKGIIKEDGSDIENIPYKETSMYVRKIIRNYKIYKQIYNE